jgi:uncharacterized iron-regulated membrane protein
MLDQQPSSSRAAHAAQGRIIAALLVVALILGMRVEGVQLTTGIFNIWTARSQKRASKNPAPASPTTAPPSAGAALGPSENCSVFERGSNRRELCDLRERQRQRRGDNKI